MIDESKATAIYFSVSGVLLVAGLVRAGYRKGHDGADATSDVLLTICAVLVWPYVFAFAAIALGVLPFWLLFKLGEWKRRNDDGGKP